jgi:hypothetical protein
MDLKDEQWSFIEPLLPKKKVRKDGTIGRFLMAYFGFLELGRSGKTCQSDTRHIKRAIEDFKCG